MVSDVLRFCLWSNKCLNTFEVLTFNDLTRSFELCNFVPSLEVHILVYSYHNELKMNPVLKLLYHASGPPKARRSTGDLACLETSKRLSQS
jgi:hypothetical protein